MGHDISIQNGKAEMFSGRGMVPWHHKQTNSTIVEGLLTAKEAIKAAHLDWTVSGRPVTVAGIELPFPTDKKSTGTWQGICRDDTNACLGITGGVYQPIQNAEAFSFFDSIIGEGKAVYDTAGALRGGEKVWLLAKVNGEIEINGDAHREYALMTTSHTGGNSLFMMYVLTRVVCQNTLSIALQGASNIVRVRHTSNWEDRRDEAKRILGIGEKYFGTIQEALAGMSEKLMTAKQMEDFTKLLIPAANEDELTPNLRNIRAEVNKLFCAGDGNKGQSRWDALNAVTDYADHVRNVKGQNSRLESSMTGSGAALKQKAYDILTNEDVMGPLLAGTFVPTGRTVDPTFSALLERN
jgi:phage/plasmid-like protein (TIGR03299 family)